MSPALLEIGTALLLHVENDTATDKDARRVQSALWSNGVRCGWADPSNRSEIGQAQVMIVFQSSAMWRAVLDPGIAEAGRCGLALVVLTRPTDAGPWPSYRKTIRYVPISSPPNEQDTALLVHTVKALLKTAPASPVTVRVFAYANEPDDYRTIHEAAATVARTFPRPTRLDVVTWSAGHAVTPDACDAVVSIFENNLAIRLLLAMDADRRGSSGPEARHVSLTIGEHTSLRGGFVYLRMPQPLGDTFEQALATLQAEAETARDVLTAWYARPTEGLYSLWTFSSRVDQPYPAALQSYLIERVASVWQARDQAEAEARELERKKSEPDPMAERERVGPVAYCFREPEPPFPPPVPPTTLSRASLAAYAPAAVLPGREFLLDIWAFNADLRESVKKEAVRQGRAQMAGSKGPIAVGIGTTLTVSVTAPSFHVEPPVDMAVWDGMMANTTFVLCAHAGTRSGLHIGTATITSGAIPIAVLRFELAVQAAQSDDSHEQPQQRAWRIRTAFASYASADRVDVLQWARGAEAAGVDVFLDVLSLREAAGWETELLRQVPSRDLFCLFWSTPASASKWVDMEWRCALALRGLDYIHPVPLVDPRDVPPPEELRTKHFTSVSFIVREYEKGIAGQKPTHGSGPGS